ncbi:uncharacterized protein LOC135823836 isoform X1 [Sycon ciliatum]|uniref:uncharacterized protein LOC135823836 isoform X1 n=2 Tax=Sycon ciliatum TaxID=27933 RepID=UPI0031F6E1C6
MYPFILLTCVVLSSACVPTCSAVTLVVQDRSEAVSDAPGQRVLRRTPCGAVTAPCTNLRDALETLRRLRSTNLTLSTVFSSARAGSTVEYLLPNVTVTIRLLAVQEAGCHIAAAYDGIATKYPITIHNYPANVIIKGSRDRGCKRAIIVAPRETTSEIKTIVLIQNSSAIVLRDISIDWELSAARIRPTLIYVMLSNWVRLENVKFTQRSFVQKLMVVSNSQMIQVQDCVFDGSPLKSSIIGPFDKIIVSAAVVVYFNRFNASDPDILQKLDALRPQNWPKTSWSPSDQETVHRNTGTPLTSPNVLFIRCEFTSIGGQPPLIDQRLKSLGVRFSNGIALSTLFRSRAHSCSVAAVNCSFDTNRSPGGTAVRFEFSQGTRNVAAVLRSSFTSNEGLFAGALCAYFRLMAASCALLVHNCSFEKNLARNEAGGLGVYYSDVTGKTGNLVSVIKSSFTRNSAGVYGFRAPGGAILAVSDQARSRAIPNKLRVASRVRVENCKVLGNKGFGAIHSVRTTILFSGNNVVSGNNLTALALSEARVNVTGNLTIRNNHAANGGAIRLEQNSIIDASEAESFIIRSNTARDFGSAVYADQMSSTVTLEDIVHSVNVDRGTTTCPIQLPRDRRARHVALQALLLHNGSKRRTVSAWYMASLHRCYEYLKPYLNQITNDKYGKYTDQCYCMPYAPAAWDGYMQNVYTHQNEKFDKVRCDYILKPDFQEICPKGGDLLEMPRAVSAYPTSACWPSGSNRSRLGAVRDLRMRANATCGRANANLWQPARCHSRAQDIFVVDQIPVKASKPPVLGTNAAWIVFHKASTSCYKPVGNDIWYYERYCSSTTIIPALLNHQNQLNISTDCVLQRLNFKYQRLRKSTAPFLPGYKLVMLPWAGSLHTWDQFEENMPSTCIQSLAAGTMITNQSISMLTLHPAPGEKFDLSLKVADEIFNLRAAPLSIKASSNGSPVVLLGQERHVYGPEEIVVFSSLYALNNIVLYGPVGASGNLEITVMGHKAYFQVGDRHLVLRIPFVLRRCHLGFRNLTTSRADAESIVGQLSQSNNKTDQKPWTYKPYKIAVDDDKQKKKRLRTKSKPRNPAFARVFKFLSCQCAKPGNEQCVVDCYDGRHVKISERCWAGDQSETTITATGARVIFAQLNKASSKSNTPHSYSAGWPRRDQHRFVSGFCERIECQYRTEEQMLTERNGTWWLTWSNPCATECHCTGPLCSVCLDGYIRLPSSIGCVDCRKAKFKIHFWTFFLLMTLASLLLVVALLLLNIGVSPTLDSWYLFTQLFCNISGYSSWHSGQLLRAVNTFGLGLVCQYKSVTVPQASTSQLFIPLFMVIVTLVMWVMARRGVATPVWKFFQKRNSIIQVFWLVILCSSYQLAYVSMTILRKADLSGKPVVFHDGTLRYFGPEHFPSAVIAICTLVFVVLPMPVLLLW